MCDCSYYNIVSDFQMMSLHSFNCKILFSILSDFNSIVKYCFPFFPISRFLRGTHRTDLFVEVTNLTKGYTIWAHYTLTGYYPTSFKLSGQILKENVHIMTS